ncbi:hypothetical protein PV326_002803 [Microctonus aethiopoides]|nr:hypothetical protein PV326_002803 [Microctonus aethiopoides]
MRSLRSQDIIKESWSSLCVTGIFEYYSLINDGSTYMYDLTWIVNLFPQIINSIAISTFVVILAKIRRRHSMINNSIVELKYLKKNEVSTIVSTEINNVFKLKLLREMYEICDNIALKINNTYGFILLMSLALFFIAMCAHLKIVYSTFGLQNDVIDCVVDTMWTCFYFGKFLYIINACQSYATEGKRASRVLHEYRVDANHHLLKQENESFARQVGNRDIRINACNFVAIDYSLLAKPTSSSCRNSHVPNEVSTQYYGGGYYSEVIVTKLYRRTYNFFRTSTTRSTSGLVIV